MLAGLQYNREGGLMSSGAQLDVNKTQCSVTRQERIVPSLVAYTPISRTMGFGLCRDVSASTDTNNGDVEQRRVCSEHLQDL